MESVADYINLQYADVDCIVSLAHQLINVGPHYPLHCMHIDSLPTKYQVPSEVPSTLKISHECIPGYRLLSVRRSRARIRPLTGGR